MTIRDVIKIARTLTDVDGVIVERDSILSAFGRDLDQQEEAYITNQPIFQDLLPFRLTSVDKCIYSATCAKLSMKSVDIVQVLPEVQSRGALYGYIDYKKQSPTIVIKANLRPCWKRFIIAKELLHLYSETAEDADLTEASVLVKAAMDSRTLLVNEATELDDETATFYLAIEVMVPWCLRSQFTHMSSRNATTMQIAKAFMVPECIISHMLSDSSDRGSSYLALSRRLNLNI